jgi:preprotein translocase subunit SecA
MISSLGKRLFGTANDRYVKRLDQNVEAINALEPELEAMSDSDLAARTPWFRERLDAGESLDDLLVEAFATVREAAKRTLGQRHFDVQLMGGIVLHRGTIAEMKTGEGKTLVATLPVYLNALSGKGVHVITVNDYLARRDAQWMGQIYRFLGIEVGCIVHGLLENERHAAYAADVTYGTNNEFGFDYLRDNMKFKLEELVQRDFNFGIVDEVDSILIDEARTPLIISGPTQDSSELYVSVNKLIPKLGEDDYEKDEKGKSITFTEDGVERVEELLREMDLLTSASLYDSDNITLLHHVTQALRAHKMFERDTDYIVKDDKVIIIDEFTGRMMEGRRYSEGLHQALEAREEVSIQQENQTLASITFQNYFRLYPKLAGMTGTAMTEASEFLDIYSLDVIDIPTNVPFVRVDFDDEVYRTAKEKYDAILDQIEECHRKNQPILVGTVSIEKSEHLAALLKERKIPHHVLNARYHEQEAFIIAQAGVPGAVTIATNMAGRGTDIQLGGNADMLIQQEASQIEDDSARAKKTESIQSEVAAGRQVALEAGGLFVMGTERHESRRIDNQLRGRCGRQGDPGASKFYLSLEDDLMRIFGSERMDSMLRKLGLQEGEAIVHPWVNKALEKAQQKVEAHHFEARKYVLKYDNVMNDQRKVIYEQRRDLMGTEDVHDTVSDFRHQMIEEMVAECIPAGAYAEQWDLDRMHEESLRLLSLDLPVQEWGKEEGIADQEILERITQSSDKHMAAKRANIGGDLMRMLEKEVLLLVVDRQWKDHLHLLDHLRQGIVLRAYGQRDPLNEYKREAFELFEAMLDRVRSETTSLLSYVRVRPMSPKFAMPTPDPESFQETRFDPAMVKTGDASRQTEMALASAEAAPIVSMPGKPVSQTVRRRTAEAPDPGDPESWGKVPRNAPCPCGSGKKYKHCHGRTA